MVLNLAVIILSLTGLYPSRALSAVGLSTSATPDLWMSSLPLLRILNFSYRMSSTPIQWVSDIPMMSHLNFCNSCISSSNAPAGCSVLTFQQPTVRIDFGVRMVDYLACDLSAAPLP